MTEIQPYQPQPIETYQDVAVHRLTEWAQSADAAYKVATKLVDSSFVPAVFKGKPVEATAAILAGIEIGLSPMSALKAFDIIQGQAAPRAITQRAVALAHGHSIVLLESTTTRCRIKCRRKGEDDWQPITWTIDRAQQLGLTGKDSWKKQPTAMLLARATSEAARLVAADALLGIAYSVEELVDGVQPVEDETVTPQPEPTTRRMSRRPGPRIPDPPAPIAEDNEPDDGLAEFVEATTHNPVTQTPISKPQLAKLHAIFGEMGITDRESRLSTVSNLVGRHVESSNDLSKAEAMTLIDQIEAETRPAGETLL
jgi:hypothetical protein